MNFETNQQKNLGEQKKEGVKALFEETRKSFEKLSSIKSLFIGTLITLNMFGGGNVNATSLEVGESTTGDSEKKDTFKNIDKNSFLEENNPEAIQKQIEELTLEYANLDSLSNVLKDKIDSIEIQIIKLEQLSNGYIKTFKEQMKNAIDYRIEQGDNKKIIESFKMVREDYFDSVKVFAESYFNKAVETIGVDGVVPLLTPTQEVRLIALSANFRNKSVGVHNVVLSKLSSMNIASTTSSISMSSGFTKKQEDIVSDINKTPGLFAVSFYNSLALFSQIKDGKDKLMVIENGKEIISNTINSLNSLISTSAGLPHVDK